MSKKVRYLAIFSILGAFFRRWFGGGFKDVSRFWKYLFLVLCVFLMYFLNYEEFPYKDLRMYLTTIAMCVFWAIGHGDYFVVNNEEPDEERLKWVDWILRKIYGENNYYNFWGNITGMFIRYTATAILVAVCIPSFLFITAGALVAFSYGLMGKLFPNKAYTEYAEYMAGALVFGLLYLCI